MSQSQEQWQAWLAEQLSSAEVVTDDALYEHERLEAVARLRADELEHVEPLVDDLLAAGATGVGAPVALFNVVLTGAQLIAGEHGLTGWMAEARATPAEWAPCAQVVRSGAQYVVPDLTADEATRHSPLTVVDGFRAYAGVPVRTSDGAVVGSVCVLDTAPRTFTEGDLDRLRAIAARAVERLEAAAGQE